LNASFHVSNRSQSAALAAGQQRGRRRCITGSRGLNQIISTAAAAAAATAAAVDARWRCVPCTA
jgi:hypothetical protein